MKTDDEIRNGIKNALIAAREEKGLTQLELSKIINKTPTAVASWEQGLSLPNLQTLYRLATFYGKTLDYMFGDPDPEERNEEQ